MGIAHAVTELVEERHVVALVVGIVSQKADVLQPQRTAAAQSALNVERSPRENLGRVRDCESSVSALSVLSALSTKAVVVDPQRILILLCREQVGHVQRHGHGLAAMRGVHGEPVRVIRVFEIGEADAPCSLDGRELLVIGIFAFDAQGKILRSQMRVFQDKNGLPRRGRILLVR